MNSYVKNEINFIIILKKKKRKRNGTFNKCTTEFS